jgi:DUF4097 and DUF4098 domain-containing protein YvlB
MNRIRTATAVVIASLSVAAWAAIESPIHKTFNVAPGGTLTLEADVGDVRVSSGGTGVTIDVKRRARSEEAMRDFVVTFDQQGNDVRVRAKSDRSSHWWFSWSNDIDATFVITVPSQYNLNLSTSGGDIKIGDLQGQVRARTSGGDLDLGKINGPVDGRTSGGDMSITSARGRLDLYTSGGDIKIGDIDGPATAKTSGGSIEVHRVGGDLFAHTSGGSISIDEASGAIDASTSGGSIRARFAQQPRGDSRLATSGGGITVSIAGNVAVDVDAHTSGGDVETDLPITILGKQSEGDLAGKINGGGPRLVLRSSGGSIKLRRM